MHLFCLSVPMHVHMCVGLDVCPSTGVETRGQPWMPLIDFHLVWNRFSLLFFPLPELVWSEPCSSFIFLSSGRSTRVAEAFISTPWRDWLFFSRQLSVANVIFDKGGTSWLSLVSMLPFCLAWACVGLCMFSRLLWIHMCFCPAVSQKALFCGAI